MKALTFSFAASFVRAVSPRLRFLLIVLSVFLIPLSLLRVAFWIRFEDPADPLPIGLLLRSLYVGFKFDLRLSLLILLPAIAVVFIRPLNPFSSRFGKPLINGYLTMTALFLSLAYMFDFGHFAYLRVRLNATAVRLLEDTAISVTMLWQAYPILWMVLALVVIAAFYAYLLSYLIAKFRGEVSSSPPSSRGHKILTFVLGFVFVLLGLYGKVSYYPLRWSDAFFSTNAFASAVALNPVLYLYDTFKAGGGVRYDEQTVRSHYDEMAAYLGVDTPDRDNLVYTRLIRNRDEPAGQPNIVVVLLESFSYHTSGLYGGPLDTTPNFNALAREGLSFENFFTPHFGTARAVFATLTGIPDVETHSTSTRNPMIVCQHTIVNAFKGYEKFYFLGGSASWGNIRGLLSRNIPGLTIYEEGSFKSPRADVWGISDLALFDEANQRLKQARQPFFAIIQTAGNHSPNTIPKENGGFQVRSLDSETLEKNGFESVEEWNAFRFLDHCLGAFMKMARKEAYFDDTLFVFLGDHGMMGRSSAYAPKWEAQLQLASFHVPFVVYSPKRIREGVIHTTVVSQVDVLPTLAGLVLNEYEGTTLGRDMLDPRFNSSRYVFTIVNNTLPEIGLLDNEFYFLMNEDGTNKRLFQLGAETPRENVLSRFPKIAAARENLLYGMHETSKYMLYHNGCE